MRGLLLRQVVNALREKNWSTPCTIKRSRVMRESDEGKERLPPLIQAMLVCP